MAPRSIEQVST